MNKMTAWMKGLLLLTLMVGGQAGAEVETVTYLHTDHLGSPIMGRDASGNTVFREEYGPWGQQLSATTPSDDVTYTGHANEGDIGLTYMKARWYDPAVGRFLSPDPVTFDGGGAGHLNRYVYVSNNPYSKTDPTGKATSVLGSGLVIGGIACTKIPACVTAVGSVIAGGVGLLAANQSDEVGGSKGSSGAVDGLIGGSEEVGDNSGKKRKQRESNSDLDNFDDAVDAANDAFDDLGIDVEGSFETDKGEGRWGYDDSGRKVTVRPRSKEGRPTIEVTSSNSNTRTEIRFGSRELRR